MDVSLGQDQIDALFASAQADPVDQLAAEAKTGPKHEPYNFSRAGEISNEQMKAISTVNDLFARNLTHNLGAWLRTQFQVTLAAGEQIVYAEFLARVPELAYVCSMRLDPLDIPGVIQMDLTMAPVIVDLLLGGVGRPGPLREPTDIEGQILMSVMEIVVRELNVAWQDVGLQFTLEQRETEAQITRLMPLSEKMLCVGFEVRMPAVQGTFNLCLPAVVLNTILRRLISERNRPKRRSEEARARLSGLMGETKFGAVMQFSPMRLRARDLANLAPGYVLRLPLARHAPAELRVGGLPIFQAQPVRLGEHRGAQMKGHTPEAQRPGAQ